MQAGILAESILLEMKIPAIWVKTVRDRHGGISTSSERIVYPEFGLGRRVAHLDRGAMRDYVELSGDFALVKNTSPKSINE
jgi:trk system potassium uptake protein TrkA